CSHCSRQIDPFPAESDCRVQSDAATYNENITTPRLWSSGRTVRARRAEDDIGVVVSRYITNRYRCSGLVAATVAVYRNIHRAELQIEYRRGWSGRRKVCAAEYYVGRACICQPRHSADSRPRCMR